MNENSKLFVSNLNFKLDEKGLRRAFDRYGQVEDVRIIRDPNQLNRSRGFGFVTFATVDQARSALVALNGADLDGRALRIEWAKDKQQSRPRSGERYRRDDLPRGY